MPRGSLWLGVVVTIALGVAALTTTFAIVRASLWREPPFPDADRIGVLFLERNPANEPARRERWSFPRSEQFRATQHSFDAVATFSATSLTNTFNDRWAISCQLETIAAIIFLHPE